MNARAAGDQALAVEVATVAGRYRLRLGPQRLRGRSGGRRGHGVGSSQEFFDFRDYAPGDDLRYLDWRGYGRTGQLRVRLHEQEVSPNVDLLLDTSASLAATVAKEHAVRALVMALGRWARHEGTAPRVLELGGGPIAANGITFANTAVAPAPPAVHLRPGGVRVLVTDGLWLGEPTAVLQRLSASAARFFCLQVLDPWELAPTAGAAATLLDCETGERREVHFDAPTIAAYHDRLQRLCDTLRNTVLGGGGVYARIAAGPLAAMCARDLLPAGVLEPA